LLKATLIDAVKLLIRLNRKWWRSYGE